MHKKFCGKCNLYLDISLFKKVMTKKMLDRYTDGYYWCCSQCFKTIEWKYDKSHQFNRKMRRRDKLARRFIAVKQTYGLSETEYVDKINDQQNKCAICRSKDEGKVLCVDHDHKTNKVRGLLCGRCNVGLGNLKDSIQILQSAIEYLQKYSIADCDSLNKGEINKTNA